ncbi:MAG: hypothetical protein GTN73_03580 [Candidatus Aminicenantes bacterium]|nr:hypothetical protein [Candidatus Aminicenantes bacterium]
MCKNNLKNIGCSSLFILLMAGCVASPAPKGWLPKLSEAQIQAFGAWLTVEYISEAETKMSQGELIAVQDNNVYLLTGYGVDVVSTDMVQKATIALYKEKRKVGTWALFGTLSTLSHGLWLIISAPVWIITGVSNAVGESKSGTLRYPNIKWQEIQKYARFPQGIPKGLRLESLR